MILKKKRKAGLGRSLLDSKVRQGVRLKLPPRRIERTQPRDEDPGDDDLLQNSLVPDDDDCEPVRGEDEADDPMPQLEREGVEDGEPDHFDPPELPRDEWLSDFLDRQEELRRGVALLESMETALRNLKVREFHLGHHRWSDFLVVLEHFGFRNVDEFRHKRVIRLPGTPNTAQAITLDGEALLLLES